MILFNHLDLVVYTIIASILFAVFFKILFKTKALLRSVMIFVFLPFFLITYPIYHFNRLYKNRTDLLRALKKIELSEEKRKKVRKSLSSKRRMAFYVVKSLIINFRPILDVYVEVAPDHLSSSKRDSYKEIKEDVFDDTKDSYIGAI